jgi:short-subunit dehydrogenase involved in D-alanine esterification of teichoic acids
LGEPQPLRAVDWLRKSCATARRVVCAERAGSSTFTSALFLLWQITMDFSGRKVLVTGASSGVGHALARRFAARGCRLVLSGRDLERLHRVARETAGVALPADLTRRDEVSRLAVEIAAAHPDLSVLVNNAGIQLNYDLAEAALETPERLLENIEREVFTNLVAPMQLSALLLPQLQAQAARTGTVSALVNVTSVLALAPKKTAAVYSASKAGLRAFTRALRYQADDNHHAGAGRIIVAEAMLPIVDTPMTAGREVGAVGKMEQLAAAEEILSGLEAERPQIRVGKAKALDAMFRVAPAAVRRLLREQ